MLFKIKDSKEILGYQISSPKNLKLSVKVDFWDSHSLDVLNILIIAEGYFCMSLYEKFWNYN